MEFFKKPAEEPVKLYLIRTHKGQIDLCERWMGGGFYPFKQSFGNLNDAVNRANAGYIAKPFFWCPGYPKSEVQFHAPLDNYMTEKGLHIAKFIEDADKYKANPAIATDKLGDKVKELIDYCKKNGIFIDDQYRLINEPQQMNIAISETERVTITYK
jgi:hypothetical protein